MAANPNRNTYDDVSDTEDPRHLQLVTDDLHLEAVKEPRKRRTGLLVAGALGGGAIVGGGVVAAASLLVLAVAGAGAGWWYYTSASPDAAEVAPVEAPVEEPVDEMEAVDEGADDEGTDGEAVATDAAPVKPAAGTSSAPSATPASTTTAPVTSAPAPAPAAAPGELVTVKFLTDPPAATVFVDGVDVGRTPLKVEVEAGARSVRIESGKASGTFDLQVGGAEDRWCFAAKGKKVDQTGC